MVYHYILNRRHIYTWKDITKEQADWILKLQAREVELRLKGDNISDDELNEYDSITEKLAELSVLDGMNRRNDPKRYRSVIIF